MAGRVARAVTAMPEVGTGFLGFQLIEELGRGAFGRVYLARQGDLANRPVALKVSADIFGESQTLAQMQHTNIVPVYSAHREGPLQAVCMPYLGSTTLAHVLESIEGRESLPVSGMELVSTLHQRRQSTRCDAGSLPGLPPTTVLPAETEPPAAAAAPPAADSRVTLKRLEGLTYVQAVLWIGARLADGLGHAHEREIVHRDLKPANVLLTDDGQPMLLDFNFAQDTKLRSSPGGASVGGTLPYMAPEHLDALQDGSRPVDGRSDLYALGILLYELLTGRPAFPTHRGALREVLHRMVEDRLKGGPRLRDANRAATRAVEAIVRHCLKPGPAKRYQTARQLQTDLEGQLADLPLRHAPEPSLRERVAKFRRRHPLLASTTAVATLALAVVAGLAAVLVTAREQVARWQARDAFAGFRADMQTSRFLLYGRTGSPTQLDVGLDQCRRALDRYEVLDNPSWQALPAVRRLPAEDRDQLRAGVGELLFLSARAKLLEAAYRPDAPRREEQVGLALRFNDAAAACYDDDQVPPRRLEAAGRFARAARPGAGGGGRLEEGGRDAAPRRAGPVLAGPPAPRQGKVPRSPAAPGRGGPERPAELSRLARPGRLPRRSDAQRRGGRLLQHLHSPAPRLCLDVVQPRAGVLQAERTEEGRRRPGPGPRPEAGPGRRLPVPRPGPRGAA
jgi:serine/threonine protein kinase